MVISVPSSSCTIVTTDFTYSTEAARCASFFAARLRSPRVSVTAPQQRMPYCFRSGRDDLVVYCCGSPLISMLSKPRRLMRFNVTSSGSARIQLCVERCMVILVRLLTVSQKAVEEIPLPTGEGG